MAHKLWTKDFTIITVGSVVSMLGGSLSSFAMSLLVLDYTGSTFLFALYNVLYMLPSAVVPMLCGPFLDRFSRRKTIYTLDFLTAGLYVLLAGILWAGAFNFTVLAVGCVILGTIGSIYQVAYSSFYPLLISEGNYSRAYSVASTLETLTMVMVPLSALIYNTIGIVPLFLIAAPTFLVAAIMETRIKAPEAYLDERRPAERRLSRQLVGDFKEGLSYLWAEKGLLAVTVYFAVSYFGAGVSNAVTLPYFRERFAGGEYIYSLVMGMSSVGRAIGGGIHYKWKLPVHKKFAIAMTVYVAISVLEGGYLFCPVWLMAVMCFVTGILGVTSYNIRIAATQKYVPDEKKGRFNGAFNTFTTVGLLGGQLLAGALAEGVPIRGLLAGSAAITVMAAFLFVFRGRRQVARIYNVED